MSEWYNDLKSEDFGGKHVVVTLDDGMTISGALSDTYGLTAKKENDTCSAYIFMAETVPVITGRYTSPKCLAILVCMEDNRWRPLDGITSVGLVWDERDWDRIDAKDLSCGDAVVANGRLYKVRAMGMQDEHYPFVLTDTPGLLSIDLRLVSCALRRKVSVPSKYGYYRDRDGFFWARTVRGDEKHWHPIDQVSMDTPVMSDEAMASRMPLTPVHFESGRAA